MIVTQGRWQDVLPGSYDPDMAVVITDPPYGLAANDGPANSDPSGKRRGQGQLDTRPRYDIRKGYEDTIPWTEHVAEVLELLPARRHVIRGPSTTLIRRDYPQPRRLCVELAASRRRGSTRPGVVPHLWQGWAVYGRLKIERHKEPPRGDALYVHPMRRDTTRPKTTHRALTPLAAAIWIIDTWVDPGCVVIDPFAGLGTIGLAARTLGFDYIGAELVPEYAGIANEAFTTERLQLGLSA